MPDRVEMVENGILYQVDVKHGQKTGFFLDQKQNRAAIAPLCPGARVLDCFCHNGSFALNAAKYGAADVLGVDISEEALEVARENAAPLPALPRKYPRPARPPRRIGRR